MNLFDQGLLICYARHWVIIAIATGLCACANAPKSSHINVIIESAPSVHASFNGSEQSQSVTIYAMGLVGTPYRFGGNTPESGFDCSGLIAHVYREAGGFSVPRTVAKLQQWGRAIAHEDLTTGDLLVFGSVGAATHAGIYVGAGRFVHAPSTGGHVRLDWLNSPHWRTQHWLVRRP